VNCCVLPAGAESVPGVTAIEVNTAAVTVSVADPEIDPTFAIIVALPCARAVASPPLTVAIAGFEEVHVAVLVRFCVVPLLNEPVAVNC
jgi:hypothetical protein